MKKFWIWEKVIILHWRQRTNRNSIHWPQNTRNWIPWLKEELENIWYEVYNPLIKNDWEVKYDEWKNEIEKIDQDSKIDNNTTLVWHSAWWAFWVRWLGETKRVIKKLILVVPVKSMDIKRDNWFDSKNWFWKFEIDQSIKNRVSEIYVFISNDQDFIVEDGKNYAKILGAKLIELPNRWHFSIWEWFEVNYRLEEVLCLV